MSSSGAAIRIESVSHQFKIGGSVLDQINLNIQPGEFVSLLGPSGCGKSTLLRLISGLDRPLNGSISLSDQSKSFVFQESTLLPWRTALKNVELPLEIAGHELDDNRKKSLASLAAMGLSESTEKYPQELSGGMKMRVSVARALVTNPSLLLLDEPFAALDESTRYSLQDDLRNRWLARGMTVVFVTHSISEAVYVSDRVIVLSGKPGKIIADHKVNLEKNRSENLRLSLEFLEEVRRVSALLRGAKDV